ncbi:MAG: hypothetical protein ACLPT4_00330 [Verrucomicrobiia bacterium]
MNAYDRFLTTLLAEFKRKAQPQVRSLWADLMELAEAADEPAFAAAREQALHRNHILGRAAEAAHAHAVQSLSNTLELTLRVLTQTHIAARPGLIDALYQTMNRLTEALCLIDTEAPLHEEDAESGDRAELVASCAE